MDTAGAKGKSRQHPLPWLNLMVTEPFFLLHLLTFFSYFAARSSASHTFSPDTSRRLLHWEIQAILTFLVLTAVKIVKEETWEAFIADTLLYAKGFLLALALVIDYHVALCYVVVFLAIFVLAQQPPYDGLGDSSHLTPLQLESLLTEGNTSRFWLVEFRAMCSSLCIRTSRIFPELSIIYANKHISFGIVDLGHFPNAAEKFGIPFGGNTFMPVSFKYILPLGYQASLNLVIEIHIISFSLSIVASIFTGTFHPHLHFQPQVHFLLTFYLKMLLKLVDFQISIAYCKIHQQLLPRTFCADILSLIGD